MTITCLDTLIQHSDPLKEIFMMSNNSQPAEYEAVKRHAERYPNVTVVEWNRPFNYHKLNNWGVKHATKGKVLFLLNNDIEFNRNSIGLIRKMYEAALQPKTGAVGEVLLYKDKKTIQHAGVYLLPGGTARHLYAGEKLKDVSNPANRVKYPYDITKRMRVGAVTAAAVMVERAKFSQVGGFDERLIICSGDVDLCFRLIEKGYHNLLMGSDEGTIIHKESKTRGASVIPYADFYGMYNSYIKHFDLKTGDKYLHWAKIRNLLHE